MSRPENTWGPARLIAFWAVMLAALLLPRLLLQRTLPVYLFTDDSHSYLLSAFHWTQTGDWETSPRRGAIYSLLVAGVLRIFQNLNAVPPVQHFLGGLAMAAGLAVFRLHLPRWLFWLALPVGAAYALAGFPIFFEQTIRSETLLLLFSTIALGAWGWYLWRRGHWPLLISGAAFGVATLIKNLLLPFPLVVIACLLADGVESWSRRWHRIGLLTLGMLLPFLANEGINRFSRHPPEPAPQSGILLYGRVAQWTVLDSTSQPEVKQLIRDDIEDYRKLPRLNNNIILKRTAVPHLAAWLQTRGGSRADLNRICRDLAVEAILANPKLWLEQIASDCSRLHWKMKFPIQTPDRDDLEDALNSTSKMKHQHPMLRQREVLNILVDPETAAKLGPYHRITSAAWLFLWHPVLLTSLLLPLLILFDRGPLRRPFWITSAVVWYFNVLIICTIGRPIPRYLMAALPIMFWTLGGGFLLLCAWLARLGRFRHPHHSPSLAPTRIPFPKL